MRKFILIASALVCFSCTFLKFVPNMDSLNIGDKIDCRLFMYYHDDHYLNGSRWYHSKVDGIEFKFLIFSDTVRIIHVSDSSFISPEGVSIGTTLNDLKKMKFDTFVFQDVWDTYTLLPSGWMACFIDREINDESEVTYFMKKYYAVDWKSRIRYRYDVNKGEWIPLE